MYRLKINNLNVFYHKKQVLSNICLTLTAKQNILILGDNGSGKTTLINSIFGIKLQNFSFTAQKLYTDKNIALIQQNPSLAFDPMMKIHSQIKIYNRYNHNSFELFHNYMKFLSLNYQQIKHLYPSSISAGTLQKINISLILSSQPKLLICDEPTENLDDEGIDKLFALLKAYKKNASLIIVSHNIKYLDQFPQDIFFINAGILNKIDKNKDNIFFNKYLNSYNYINKYKSVKNLQKKEISAKKYLLIKNLVVSFTNKKILDNINCTVYEGEKIGLIGRNSSGKTSFLKSIAGIITPQNGKIVIQGKTIDISKRHKHIGFIFQNARSMFNPSKKIISAIKPYLLKKEQIIRHLLTELKLNTQNLQAYPHQLSGGQLQKLAIIRVVLSNKKIILCDEITSSLDIVSSITICEFLKKLPNTIIFSSHNKQILKIFAHRIISIEQGKINE